MAHTLPTNLFSSCDEGIMYCFGKWAYNVSGFTYWTFMLLGFCFAVYMATSRMGNSRAFGFGSFVGMIGAIFLAVLNFMSWWIASAFILVGVIGIAVMIISER